MFLLLLMAHVVLSFIWTYYFFYFMGSLSSKQQYAKLIQKGSSIPIYQWQTYWNRNQESNLFSNFVKNILNKSNSGNKSLLYWKFKVTRQYFDEDTTRWKDLPFSCVHKINITKMVSTQSNLPIQWNTDQNSNVILTEIEKTILKSYGSTKDLDSQNSSVQYNLCLMYPHLRFQVIILSHHIWIDILVLWNRIWVPDITPCINNHASFDKDVKNTHFCEKIQHCQQNVLEEQHIYP